VADFTGLISCGKHDVFLLECRNPSSSPAAPSDAELALAAPSLSPAGGRPERRGPRLEGSPPRAREQASRGKRARHGGVGYGITHAHALAPQSPRPSGPNTPARARGLSRAPRGRCRGASLGTLLHFLPAPSPCERCAYRGRWPALSSSRGLFPRQPPLHGAQQAAALARPASTVPRPSFRSRQVEPVTCTSRRALPNSHLRVGCHCPRQPLFSLACPLDEFSCLA